MDINLWNQVAISALQGIIEGKGGFIGEALPNVLVREAFRIADAYVEELKQRETNQETL